MGGNTMTMKITSNKARTNIYLNKTIKKQAQQIFSEYGLSLSDAVNMFLRQSVFVNGLPFELKIPKKENIPNDETIKALQDCENNVGAEVISLDDLLKDMKQNV